MKTIQKTDNTEIKRISDDRADKMVETKKWKFVPKSVYKEAVKTQPVTDEVKTPKTKKHGNK
jgi:hypothetical protein